MKCKKCNREVKGTICSYCGEVQDVLVAEVMLPSYPEDLRYAIIFAVLSIALGFLANFFNQVFILAIGLGALGVWLSCKHLKSAERKWFLLAGIIASLGLFLTTVATVKYVSQEIDKELATKRYGEILEVTLPKRKAVIYNTDFGYQTGYKVIMYGVQLTETEYEEIIKNIIWLEESNFYVDLVAEASDLGSYAVFDYSKEAWGLPENILKYHFIMVRIVASEGNYKLEIYDVSKRQY
ncbi:MAG TPA: hypothetical protein VJZ51_01835 [Bacilli bacterium]|nr:hypothetical protein [Bacilli bacterium]